MLLLEIRTRGGKMRGRRLVTWSILLALAVVPYAVDAGKKDEPGVVVVQHILIGFKKSIPGKKLDRTKIEARELAEELLERARSGEEEFDALVEEYTEDRHPGIYKLTNDDAPRMAGARMRREMVPGFGDVAFELQVGEVGLAAYSASMSPYGWHVIKRLE
jgi:hypothetical protein